MNCDVNVTLKVEFSFCYHHRGVGLHYAQDAGIVLYGCYDYRKQMYNVYTMVVRIIYVVGGRISLHVS